LLDRLYAHAVRARRRWYERHPDAVHRLAAPVLSVGNLTVGGSGKTPLVAALAEWLIAQGERPAILSRGYARRDPVDGVVVVSDGTRILADLARAGDEPLMLARAIPRAIVAVAEDRHLAGVVAERRLGATVHVLDDGFQHVRLARDLNVIVTSVGEIGSGRLLPFGRLREPGDAAARADLVVVMDADAAAARAEAWTLGVSQAMGAQRTVPGPSADVVEPVVAVAGIARPPQFFESLRSAGWPVAVTLAFRDHHPFTADDVARIAAAAHAANARTVVTTEKDAVRLEPLAPLPFTLRPIPVTLAFDAWDVLAECARAAIARRRQADAAS
jgi:tetraacyldisaccharide 4'-kinase